MAAFHFHVAPVSDRARILEFNDKLAACYARYGASAALRVPDETDDIRYLIVTRESQMVAGMRFHRRRAGLPVPMEGYFDQDGPVRAGLDARTDEGVAELCGLWSAPEVARTGIGGYVVGAAVAVAPYLGLRHLCSFAHQFNRFTRQVGFEPDPVIGEHAYPDERYRSTVNWCDAIDFPTADPEVRRRIQWLRSLAHDVLSGASLPLGFHPPRKIEPTARRPMSAIVNKTRPFPTTPDAGLVTRVADGLSAVETSVLPEDVRDLVSAWPSILGATPAGSDATTVCIRTDEGELLAAVTVSDAQGSALRRDFSSAQLQRTAYLSDLAWADGAAAYAPLVLYMAVRRARIRGATIVAAHAKDASNALEESIGMTPIRGSSEALDRRPMAQRVDLAADKAYRALLSTLERPLDPVVFGDEVADTFHHWLKDLYTRGFFSAVKDGTLSREQYVYTISNMHQFVRWTTRLLGHAVAHSHDKALRDHFLAHLQGEVNHEVIIERDLNHLGADVGFVVHRMAASPGTRQFMAVQESLAGMHHDLVAFLASPLAAEGIASHLTPEFLDAMERNIQSWGVEEPRKAMAFFTSHVHTDGGDDGHWEMVLGVVRKRLRSEDDVRAFLGILRASTQALTRAYDEFVDDVGLFAKPEERERAAAAE